MAEQIKPQLKITGHYEAVAHQPIDMRVVRMYTLYGINVLVELDRKKKSATLVEWDERKQEYVPKEWQFASRTVEYMNGWIAIFRAMEHAVQCAKAELERYDDDEMQKLLDMHIALNKINLSSDDSSED